MTFIDTLISNKLQEAKQIIFDRLNEIVGKKLEEHKFYLAHDRFEEVEELDEAVRRNPNILKMGRIQKIRRRIRQIKKSICK